MLSLLQDLVGVSWHIRGKYGPLGCLTQQLGAEKILGLYPDLHDTVLNMLGEQNLVPYVSYVILNCGIGFYNNRINI